MFRHIVLSGFFALVALAPWVHGQGIVIDGVTDRSTYNNSVNLRVQTNAGFQYDVRLNDAPIAAGIFHTVNRMDYYDLTVRRVEEATNAETNVLVRFIVLSSNRGSPEKGLIEWTPYPPINSAASEFAGATLHVIAPQNFPQGIDIPVIARVTDAAGEARRANGWVTAPGFESSRFRLLRGVGHGFLPRATNANAVSFNAQLPGLASNKVINIDAGTAWTTVSGILAGNNEWGTNARIHVTGHLTVPAGAELRIAEGAIVRLNSGVNITNSGRMLVNGTTERPVVFTSATRVAPEQHAGAWGGFVMRGAGAELIANGAIMTGAGAAQSFSFSPGASHRSEQALLFVHSGAKAFLTNCFLINNAGQIGNGYESDVTFDHCLLQRAITSGEYVGGTIIVNHSAVVEFPSVDGIVDANIADSDYDGIYFTTGTHILLNSLFGFCKDDAIDSGSGGAGTVVMSNCWVEAALHEALAWSGGGRQAWTYDSVLMNNGQGIEAGWSSTFGSPDVFAERLFSTANAVGARFGDNYDWNYWGFLRLTNSHFLFNYRDVFAKTWNTSGSDWNTNRWVDRVTQMDLRDNHISQMGSAAVLTNFPQNAGWSAGDYGTLAQYMRVPTDATVGAGIALWRANVTAADLTNGVPVRLSHFRLGTTTVDWAIETPEATVASGTLTFVPGETLKRIHANPAAVSGASAWRVVLMNVSGGELTDTHAVYALPVASSGATNVTLIPYGATWRYHDLGVDQGTAWRAAGFDDSAWLQGPGQLGFGDGDEARVINRTNTAGANIPTYYFRRSFNVANPSTFASLSMSLLRDDGGVVYVNGAEVFRSPSMPAAPAVITFSTYANAQGSAPPDNTVDNVTLDTGVLAPGANVFAVEIHQFNASSSDASFDLRLVGNLPPSAARIEMVRFGDEVVFQWAGGLALEQASNVLGPWTRVAASAPLTIRMTEPQQFFRLKSP